MNNFKLNSILVFLFSIAFTWFFFFSKHYYLFTKVNVFNVDPYDAVGSIGIQVSFFASALSIIRIFMLYLTGTVSNANMELILRGNFVSLLSVGVTLISDIIAMFRFMENWTNNPMGLVLFIMICFILLLTVLLGYWVIVLAKKLKVNISYRFSAKSNILILLLFFILAIYPDLLLQSIIGAIFTAYIGMVIQIIIVYSLAILIFSQLDLDGSDMIDVIHTLFCSFKTHNGFVKHFSERLDKTKNNSKIMAFINFFNPRKHDWNLIIILGLMMGIALTIIEGFGENWIGLNRKSLLLSSFFIGGEFLVIISFYLLFRKFLGIIKKN